MSEIHLDNGQTVLTGLQVPATKPRTFRRFASAVPILDPVDIRAIINAPGYLLGRHRFPARDGWIISQLLSDCNGQAAAGGLGRSRVERGCSPVQLSGNLIYAGINGGRDQGSGLNDGMEWITARGTCPRQLVAPDVYRWGDINEDALEACGRFKAFECYGAETEAELITGLALGFIAIVAVHVTHSFGSLDSKGRVPPARGPGNHAVGACGVAEIDGKFNLDMFNSHGERYGDEGHAFISWADHLRWTAEYHDHYLIRSTVDDPNDQNPPIPEETEI